MTVRIRMMTVAKTGRRTQISASFCIYQAPLEVRHFTRFAIGERISSPPQSKIKTAL
jgi:hypothetical protein